MHNVVLCKHLVFLVLVFPKNGRNTVQIHLHMFIVKICVMTQSRVSLGNRIDIMYNNSEVNIYKNLIYEMIHM